MYKGVAPPRAGHGVGAPQETRPEETVVLTREASLDQLLTKPAPEAGAASYVDVALPREEDLEAQGTTRKRASTPEAEGLLMGALPPTMRNAVEANAFASRTLKAATSLSVFFGFDDDQPFTIPANRTEFLARAQRNAFLFRSNYLGVFILASLYSVIKEPLYFLTLIAIGLIYLSLTRLYDSGDSVVISGRRISRNKATGCVLFMGVVLAAFVIPRMLAWAIGVGGVLSAVHIAFRNYSPSGLDDGGSKYNA